MAQVIRMDKDGLITKLKERFHDVDEAGIVADILRQAHKNRAGQT